LREQQGRQKKLTNSRLSGDNLYDQKGADQKDRLSCGGDFLRLQTRILLSLPRPQKTKAGEQKLPRPNAQVRLGALADPQRCESMHGRHKVKLMAALEWGSTNSALVLLGFSRCPFRFRGDFTDW
jgi:hypothetical protein